jgi:mercuric ion binding protein
MSLDCSTDLIRELFMKQLIPALAAGIFSTSVWAATQTVTLKVSGMTCPTCPITVKKALQRLPGISHVAVDYPRKEVVVTFDNSKTSEAAMRKATTDAGYPSQPVKAGQ